MNIIHFIKVNNVRKFVVSTDDISKLNFMDGISLMMSAHFLDGLAKGNEIYNYQVNRGNILDG